MTATQPSTGTAGPVTEDMDTLYREGVVARKGAFSRQWAEEMREDMMTAFWDAIQRPGGAVGRGPRRWYVEIHPQDLRGFVDLVTHPWVVAMCEAVLGPKYEIVEVGFDTPFQGAIKSALASGFPIPARNIQRPSHHLAGFQPDRRRRYARYGTVPDRARHAVG